MAHKPRALSRALLALERGNWLKAVDLLKSELMIRKCVPCGVQLATLYMQKDHLMMAENLVDQIFSWAHVDAPLKACPITPEHRQLFLVKANLRLSRGDAPEAIALYTVLLSERPNSPDLLYRMGLAYQRSNQCELALGYLNKAVEADPEFMAAMEIKGQVLLGLRRLREAIDLYTQITLARPDNVNAYTMLGRIYHHMEQPVAAVYAWERAVSLAPNADEPLRMLGQSALKQGDRTKARSFFTRSLSANPNNVAAHLDLAELLAEIGETCAALSHWDEAERLFPGHPRLARCQERREQVTQMVTEGRSPLDFFIRACQGEKDDLLGDACPENNQGQGSS